MAVKKETLSESEIKAVLLARHGKKIESIEFDGEWWKVVTKKLTVETYDDDDNCIKVPVGRYEIRVRTGKKDRQQIEFERLDGFFGELDGPLRRSVSDDIAYDRTMGAFWVGIKTSERGNPVSVLNTVDVDDAGSGICFGDAQEEVEDALTDGDALLPLDASLTIIDQEDDSGGLGNWVELSEELRNKRGQLCKHCAKKVRSCVCKTCEHGEEKHNYINGCDKCNHCRRHCVCVGVMKVGSKVRPKPELIGEDCKFGGTLEEDWAGVVTKLGSDRMWVRASAGVEFVVDPFEFELNAQEKPKTSAVPARVLAQFEMM